MKKVAEKTPGLVKNFGIWVRYDSRSGTHNMYREYRDTMTSGAVTQCYRDMGARHRARPGSIQILRVSSNFLLAYILFKNDQLNLRKNSRNGFSSQKLNTFLRFLTRKMRLKARSEALRQNTSNFDL